MARYNVVVAQVEHTTIAIDREVHARLGELTDEHELTKFNDTVALLIWYYDLTKKLDIPPDLALRQAMVMADEEANSLGV